MKPLPTTLPVRSPRTPGRFPRFPRTSALLGLLGLVVRLSAGANPGDADPAFRADPGSQVMVLGVSGLALDASGRLLAVIRDGSGTLPDLGLVRFRADGSLDPEFQPALEGSRLTSLCVLRSGKILVGGLFRAVGAGQTRTNLARLEPDGALDPAFEGGPGSIAPSGIHEDSGGRLLVLGTYRGPDGVSVPGLHRLEADGRRDETFEPAALWARFEVENFFPRPDGLVYLVGMLQARASDPVVRIARMQPDGRVDEGFQYASSDGWVYGTAASVSEDGGIHVFVQSLKSVPLTTVMDVIRLREDGTRDPGFHAEVSGRNLNLGSPSGTANPPHLFGMHRQADGRLLIAGKFDRVNALIRWNVARLNPDGSLDDSFHSGTGPIMINDTSNFGYPVQVSALAPDGGLYLAGPLDRYRGQVVKAAVRLKGSPVPRLEVEAGAGAGGAKVTWVANPGGQVEVEASPDLREWRAHHTFTNTGGVVRLPVPAGEAWFLRARVK